MYLLWLEEVCSLDIFPIESLLWDYADLELIAESFVADTYSFTV